MKILRWFIEFINLRKICEDEKDYIYYSVAVIIGKQHG